MALKKKPAPTHRAALPPDQYTALRATIMARDKYRCKNCGRAKGLELAHLQARSQGGEDSEKNLLLLCSACHRAQHDGRLKIQRVIKDAGYEFLFEDLRPRKTGW